MSFLGADDRRNCTIGGLIVPRARCSSLVVPPFAPVGVLLVPRQRAEREADWTPDERHTRSRKDKPNEVAEGDPLHPPGSRSGLGTAYRAGRVTADSFPCLPAGCPYRLPSRPD